MFSDFNLYHKAPLIKHRVVGIKTGQWNQTERPEMNLCVYGQLDYEKGAKNIQREDR